MKAAEKELNPQPARQRESREDSLGRGQTMAPPPFNLTATPVQQKKDDQNPINGIARTTGGAPVKMLAEPTLKKGGGTPYPNNQSP